MAALLPALLAGGGLLAACGGTPAAGQKACADVHRSLNLYQRVASASGAAASHDRAQALTDLRRALHDAALIGSAGGNWQALEATLEETDRVPESALVTALTAQCAALTTSGGG